MGDAFSVFFILSWLEAMFLLTTTEENEAAIVTVL